VKKYTFILLCLFFCGINVFALHDLNISIGYENNIRFLNLYNYDENYTEIYKVGIGLRGAYFWDNNIGIFSKMSVFSFITSNEFLPIILKSIAGIGFRKNINNKMALFFGLGLTEMIYDSIGLFKFGIGGEIMFKYNFNDKIYVGTGFDLTNDFMIKLNNDQNSYNIFGIQPFINIGINIITGKK